MVAQMVALGGRVTYFPEYLHQSVWRAAEPLHNDRCRRPLPPLLRFTQVPRAAQWLQESTWCHPRSSPHLVAPEGGAPMRHAACARGSGVSTAPKNTVLMIKGERHPQHILGPLESFMTQIKLWPRTA